MAKPAHRINNAGLLLIAAFEGFRSHAYRDAVGVATIGYGHTRGVRMGQTVTRARALSLLRSDAAVAVRGVRKYVKVDINQNRFNALVSFTFNCGVGALASSTLLRKLNSGDYGAVPKELLKWDKGGGVVLPGLLRRRKAEAALWRRKVR